MATEFVPEPLVRGVRAGFKKEQDWDPLESGTVTRIRHLTQWLGTDTARQSRKYNA